MSSQIDRIIETASGFIGIKESPPASNNVIFNTHYYGREVSGSAYPWCAAFVWDVFRIAGLPELYYGGERTANCAAMLAFAKSNGLYVSSGFRRGDLVLYKFDRTAATANHMGIITAFDGKKLRAIEGNTSVGNDSDGGAVMERERTLSNVVGAYRPLYTESEMSYEQFEQYMERYLSIAATGDVCSDWAEEATDALRGLGIANGSDGDFGWQKPVTKETAAQLLYNYIQKEKSNG